MVVPGPPAPSGDPADVTVLVIEDETSIAEPLARSLARHGMHATVATRGDDALARVAVLEPDVILLDLGLPDLDGREVCRRLRAERDVPIIMLTARGTVGDRVLGLELGADDYIVKPFAVEEVVARIRAVRRRVAGVPPDRRLAVRGLEVDPAARRAWVGGREVALTRREFDLLARLAADAGRVVSREQLMSDVWDANWFGSTKTLDVHIAALRRKLGDDPNAPTHIHTVRGVGFRLGEGQERAPSV